MAIIAKRPKRIHYLKTVSYSKLIAFIHMLTQNQEEFRISFLACVMCVESIKGCKEWRRYDRHKFPNLNGFVSNVVHYLQRERSAYLSLG